jgi:hypothetical protein
MSQVKLTAMQRRCIWVAGSHPDRKLLQGRGCRGGPLRWGLHGDDSVVVFGYGQPLFFLQGRGLLEKLDWQSYRLTEAGRSAYDGLLAGGGVCSTELREVAFRTKRETELNVD